jgi:hypothetical protein
VSRFPTGHYPVFGAELRLIAVIYSRSFRDFVYFVLGRSNYSGRKKSPERTFSMRALHNTRKTSGNFE